MEFRFKRYYRKQPGYCGQRGEQQLYKASLRMPSTAKKRKGRLSILFLCLRGTAKSLRGLCYIFADFRDTFISKQFVHIAWRSPSEKLYV
ncbi:hypothetical protein [Bacillus sp. T33-2]|uniref:hypothetical protein n=1 Tax=Bacillus sp. T33-2 TaxID=2054168 RepID=UPI000C76F5F5|nr:hypothetical protein [Bacillus sp. T33-2]PLR98450.1 hypothetical protein CVD19_05050 [Bacillus sp. T33-2]